MKPRELPDRDSRYMGMAWMCAALSKDPSTQVGVQIVDQNNFPRGWGVNGPPRQMDDNQVIWDRPPENDPDALCKYDLMVHAEINAINHCSGNLNDCTLYVTGLPCKNCMLNIVKEGIKRVVYYDFKSHKNSMMQNSKLTEKTFAIAKLGKVQLELFQGDISWVKDWVTTLQNINVLK